MANENGDWIMHGVPASDPSCIHTADELIAYIENAGFLPLFQNEVPGFSVEERTVPEYWWSGDPMKDPWEWRERIARSGKLAYGKFFRRKAGFISREWFPYFANDRRDGYDFDARWEDEKASARARKIMLLFDDAAELYSADVKKRAGYGGDGEKNFEGVISGLQMQTYLVMRDFRQRLNKKGEAYGWPCAVYATPEHLWGAALVTSAYREEPEASRERILARMRKRYPEADEKQIRKLLLNT